MVSASRRSDIPAFYTPWLMERLRAGYCEWIQPFNGQLRRVSLRAEECLAILFWSRYPRPLLPHLAFLRESGYRFYFHFTLNGYPPELEPHNPPLNKAIDAFERLAEAVSPELVFWRYDPIVLSDRTPPDWHRRQFARLAEDLEGHTRRCYFSFVDWYGKTEKNLVALSQAHGIEFARPETEARVRLARDLAAIGAARGIKLYACCEDALVGAGVEKAHCADPEVLRGLRPDLEMQLKRAPTRAQCGCVQSVDIGAYDTCLFGCAYCYATRSHAAARKRRARHDPAGPLLCR